LRLHDLQDHSAHRRASGAEGISLAGQAEVRAPVTFDVTAETVRQPKLRPRHCRLNRHAKFSAPVFAMVAGNLFFGAQQNTASIDIIFQT